MFSIACVSFLNSKPLIDPVLSRSDTRVHFAVPAQLLPLLESGTASAGLLSVVDYHTSKTDLLLLPAGMIGCDGPTLTVRIFSRVPPNQIRLLHGDADSHTSVILAQLILRERYGVSPPLVPLTAHEGQHQYAGPSAPQTMLLIGDKVVSAAPETTGPDGYPHQLDLGEEWKTLTGLPFVFAMWMIRKDRAQTEGPALAKILSDARRRGADLTEHLLDRYAHERGWPRDLARKYFTQYLRYEVTPDARHGLAKFFQLASSHNLLTPRRTLEYLEIL